MAAAAFCSLAELLIRPNDSTARQTVTAKTPGSPGFLERNLENYLGVLGVLAVNSRVATIVFDIETSALPPDTFDEAQREYLFREAEKIADEPARETRRAEIRQQFNLWPFTAQ